MVNLRPAVIGAALCLIAVPALACDAAKREAKEAARAEALKAADANGDGALNPQEFQAFRETMEQQMTAFRFARLDTNSDGQVTADELAAGKHGRHGKPAD